jgi:hypothetical protein
MEVQYIRRNYFELMTVIVLTVASLTRIFNPALRTKEIAVLPLGSEVTEWFIILFELSSVYFLLMAPRWIKHAYLVALAVGMLSVSLYYIATCTDLFDYKHICIFPNNPHAVTLHLVYALIFVWLAFVKA